ncbi:unnamed protein product [Protopolystoma xenopodis]|uniref:Uncharacterized protein n=1 Tax=Protopolystoma xenopodis TaxID=117903 RepID=A0A3S5CNV4_9PLAT|nr:unnamed protein product [Protopolystoma xenopodis]
MTSSKLSHKAYRFFIPFDTLTQLSFAWFTFLLFGQAIDAIFKSKRPRFLMSIYREEFVLLALSLNRRYFSITLPALPVAKLVNAKMDLQPPTADPGLLFFVGEYEMLMVDATVAYARRLRSSDQMRIIIVRSPVTTRKRHTYRWTFFVSFLLMMMLIPPKMGVGGGGADISAGYCGVEAVMVDFAVVDFDDDDQRSW